MFSDGMHHLRLDIVSGTLRDEAAVRLRFCLDGMETAGAGTLSLQRLVLLHRHQRFGRMLYPRDPAIARGAMLLRVHDALANGATHRDLASCLAGRETAQRDWSASSDSLRSRVRRLVRQARAMAAGGYKELLRR